jgi:hypothetical protein
VRDTLAIHAKLDELLRADSTHFVGGFTKNRQLDEAAAKTGSSVRAVTSLAGQKQASTTLRMATLCFATRRANQSVKRAV